MGARSERQLVPHPWPVVYEAFVHALPAYGYRVRTTDPSRGRIVVGTRTERITLSVGAVDAVTTEWVADLEQRLGLGPARHEQHLARVAAALEAYLAAYYTP